MYSISIKRIILDNFQGIKHLDLQLENKSSIIYGDNGTGKTTIYNAFIWLMFGKPSTNIKSFSPKTIDENGEVHKIENSVQAVLTTPEGNIALKKVYKEQYRKKKGAIEEEFSGHTIDYFINDIAVKEKEYNDKIKDIGNGIDLRLLIMPEYFADHISWNERRDILLKLCNNISDDYIINKYNDINELKGRLKNPITDEVYSITDFKKKVSTDKVALVKKINNEVSKMEVLNNNMPKIVINTDSLEELYNQMNNSNSKNDTEINDMTAKINIEKDKLDKLYKNLINKHEKRTKEYASKRTIIDTNLRKLSQEILQIENENKLLQKELATKKDRCVVIGDAIKAICSEKFSDICNFCKQPLPKEMLEELKNKFNSEKEAKLKSLQNEIDSIALDEIESIIDEINTNEAQIDKNNKTIDELKAELKTLENEYSNNSADIINSSEYKKQKSKIESMNIELGELISNNRVNSTEIDEITKRIAAKMESIEQNKIAEKMKNELHDIQEEHKADSRNLEELEHNIFMLKQFDKHKVDEISDIINSKFNNVKFNFIKQRINDAIEDDCDVVVPNGNSFIPFRFANTASKINAGIEIMNTLSELFDISAPIFIDNAESITHITPSKSQTIKLVVSEPDKKIRIDIEEV